MDIHNSIIDIHNSIMDIHYSIMDLHNQIKDIHNWIMDIHKWISMIELWISIIWLCRVSSGQGKVREIPDLAKVREKSGNFVEGQGKNEYWEKSGKSQGICI